MPFAGRAEPDSRLDASSSLHPRARLGKVGARAGAVNTCRKGRRWDVGALAVGTDTGYLSRYALRAISAQIRMSRCNVAEPVDPLPFRVYDPRMAGTYEPPRIEERSEIENPLIGLNSDQQQ